MSILIVDDNPVNIFVIEKILKQAGYHDLVSLNSAQELFEYIQFGKDSSRHNEIDLILLDIMMPEIDGLEVCRRLQKEEKFKDIPIIFVTALEDANKLAEALDMGAMDYITKPINKVELLARMRVALRLKSELNWHKEQEENLRNELDLATQVQRNLLSSPLREDHIKIEASYLPSFKLAGDMYYWYKIDENRYGIILLDVMGHGISASLVCMFISSVLRETIKCLIDPELVIKELNKYMTLLHNENDNIPYYFTAIYLVVNTEDRTVEYVNAGHPAGYVLVDETNVVELDRGSCAVGFFDEIKVKKTVIPFEKNAQILLFTDGVLEAIANDEFESEEKLRTFTERKWGDLEGEIEGFYKEEQKKAQSDDMCLIMIQTNAK
ncbi:MULTISPECIES: fused response regulator/phosphatase [Bacillus]|uniref:Fused response regulator/phosphatase n=3 Tax=Bacillus thuringiensis TaxID=1428 RepID=A0A9W3S7W0_BACTU|nr:MULTISPECIES: fused response regulator/phosphatase [Bacillus]AEA14630.1 sigma factor sigB regulation protein [Bacillus thuringiensis serovar chinensis CT-43]AFV16751.1 phosphoserine phosphatase RsbP [Bacillus thuringiensis Bt407]AGF99665.1 Serine phosphatase RsbU, regulator of sigma subunit [Bacillus thuringiensis serovar thuringiensis str. IS5056]ANS46580.1 phosphoserine phosphatase RsbP [Bacillus thuringiensis]ARP56406.1 response regulator [Bacillus thuringiensis]